jgi:NitT/TauT family transport system substrate-binding protein
MKRSTLIGAGFTAAAAPLFTSRAARAQVSSIRLGVAPGDPYSQGFYAADMGFFQRAGLDVDLQMLGGGAPIASAVASGAVDIGISTPIPLANAVEHGLAFTIIAPAGLNSFIAPAAPNKVQYQDAQVIVAKTSSIRGPRDLVGQTIALNALRTLGELTWRIWFQEAGVDLSKVKIVEMPFSAMGPAVERGTIAAAQTTEPALSASLRDNNVRVINVTLSSLPPEFLVAVWFSTPDYARRNPDTVRRFYDTMIAVAKWANTHRRETGDILAKYGKLDRSLVATMNRCVYADRLRPEDVQATLDPAAKYGLIPQPIAATQLIFRRA